MAAWPSTLDYSENGYGWSVSPEVKRTEYSSRNTRQRKLRTKRDDRFTISMQLDETELDTFETFVLDTLNGGADTYTGPYFVNDTEYTGTLQIVNGQYSVNYLSEDYWGVTFQMEIKDRDMTEELAIYTLVNALSGFAGLYDIMQATETAVNDNNL